MEVESKDGVLPVSATKLQAVIDRINLLTDPVNLAESRVSGISLSQVPACNAQGRCRPPAHDGRCDARVAYMLPAPRCALFLSTGASIRAVIWLLEGVGLDEKRHATARPPLVIHVI